MRRNTQSSSERTNPILTRRRLLIGGALAAGAYLVTRSQTETARIPSEASLPSRPQSKVPSKSDQLEYSEEVESLKEISDLPQVKFSGQTFVCPKPEAITVTEEKFKQVAAEFVAKTEAQLVPPLKRELSRNPEDREMLYSAFMNKLIRLSWEDPVLKPHVQASRSERGGVNQGMFKPIFLAGGRYFDFSDTVTGIDEESGTLSGRQELRLYEVASSEKTEVSDSRHKTVAPIIILGKRIFDPDEFAGGAVASEDPFLRMAIIYSTDIGTKQNIGTLLHEGIISAMPDNIAQLAQEDMTDLKRHEATHVFLSNRFPDIQMDQTKQAYATPLTVQLNERGERSNLYGYYHPAHFNELCAVGNSIAQSHSPLPLQMVKYAYASSYGYQLVNKAIIALNIKNMQEGTEKEAFVQNAMQRGKVPVRELARHIIGQSMEARRMIGLEMYKMGFAGLQAIQSGELKKVVTR